MPSSPPALGSGAPTAADVANYAVMARAPSSYRTEDSLLDAMRLYLATVYGADPNPAPMLTDAERDACAAGLAAVARSARSTASGKSSVGSVGSKTKAAPLSPLDTGLEPVTPLATGGARLDLFYDLGTDESTTDDQSLGLKDSAGGKGRATSRSATPPPVTAKELKDAAELATMVESALATLAALKSLYPLTYAALCAKVGLPAEVPRASVLAQFPPGILVRAGLRAVRSMHGAAALSKTAAAYASTSGPAGAALAQALASEAIDSTLERVVSRLPREEFDPMEVLLLGPDACRLAALAMVAGHVYVPSGVWPRLCDAVAALVIADGGRLVFRNLDAVNGALAQAKIDPTGIDFLTVANAVMPKLIDARYIPCDLNEHGPWTTFAAKVIRQLLSYQHQPPGSFTAAHLQLLVDNLLIAQHEVHAQEAVRDVYLALSPASTWPSPLRRPSQWPPRCLLRLLCLLRLRPCPPQWPRRWSSMRRASPPLSPPQF